MTSPTKVPFDSNRTTGALQERFKVNMPILLQLEQRGILTPDRDKQNRRIYNDEDIRIVEVAAKYVSMGFAQAEIYKLLSTKKGNKGVSIRYQAENILNQLADGDAELWRRIDSMAPA